MRPQSPKNFIKDIYRIIILNIYFYQKILQWSLYKKSITTMRRESESFSDTMTG